MFKKVLIAEDFESSATSVRKALDDLGIGYQYVYYCDDALVRLKKALQVNEPYDLLITDLTFEPDGSPQSITTGQELIGAVRQLQPGLKTLVFSIENRVEVIEQLKNAGINGYVRKARRDIQELQAAIKNIDQQRLHFPVELRQMIRQKNAHDFTKYDITLLKLVADGRSQKEIAAELEKNGIKPSGLSSIEKRLKLIRDAYGFSNNQQLIAFCKDTGTI
jgi:two-component system capsular synthesis response regulator RcsB